MDNRSSQEKPVEILIAEDCPSRASRLRHFLESSGFKVTMSHNGSEALELARKIRPGIVISNIMMPEMDGYELCLEIKEDEDLREISVILLTSLSDPRDVIRGLESGADSYSTIPFEGSTLLSRINQLLSDREYRKKAGGAESNVVAFGGLKYTINAGRQQILNFLLSTYETALQKNQELEAARDSLKVLNDQLEKRVAERTIELQTEVIDRKQAEEAARESERRYRTLFDCASDAIFIENLEGTYFLEANRVACEQSGYTKEELLSLRSSSIEHEDYAITKKERLENLRSLGYIVFETLHMRKEGSYIPIEMSSRIIKYAGKEVILSIARDITDRKRAEEETRKSYERSKRILEQTIGALASALEKRDPYTAGHQRRVAELSCAIAIEMGLDDNKIEGIRMAAVIHDLGKIYVPAEILNKPGRLTDLEFSIIKTHSEVGYDILRTIEFPWPVAEAVYQHHERLDGSGYPRGLTGGEIGVEARILSVADVIEAMSSHRPYRTGLGIDKALEEILSKKGSSYDPDVVDTCVSLFTEKNFRFD